MKPYSPTEKVQVRVTIDQLLIIARALKDQERNISSVNQCATSNNFIAAMVAVDTALERKGIKL